MVTFLRVVLIILIVTIWISVIYSKIKRKKLAKGTLMNAIGITIIIGVNLVKSYDVLPFPVVAILLIIGIAIEVAALVVI